MESSPRALISDGDNIPEVFTHFITSVTIWNYFTAHPDKPWVDQDVADLREAKFPVEFREYIFQKTQELKKKLNDLHKKYGIQ